VVKRGLIARSAPRLNKDWFSPLDPEPRQIFEDPVDEFWSAARAVEIVDPEEDLAAIFERAPVAQYRAIGVPEMKVPTRRWSKAGYEHSQCCRKDS
jgi:hypothetical protein